MGVILSHIWSILLLLFVCGIIFVILSSNSDPGRKISWIIIVTILPVIGIILYILIGWDMRRPEYYNLEHKEFYDFFARNAGDDIKARLFDTKTEEKIRPDYRELSRLLTRCNGTTVCDGNEVEVITNGARKFEALVQDLTNARHHIHMEYFYFRKDKGSKKIKEILMRKAMEGVKVRFIYENIANIKIAPIYYNEMKKAGVDVVKFNSSKFSLLGFGARLNYRDHRKVVVIDGEIGYTGGMNISDDYFLRWRDTHMRITGNLVDRLQYSFLNTFISSGGQIESDLSPYFPEHKDVGKQCLAQIVPDEPDHKWPIIHMGACWVAENTSDYLYIQTPYFVPPDPMLQALKITALKGADVRIMLPAKADLFFMGWANKSYFQECLEAGVKIYEKTGNFIHAKTMVSDDYLSVIGSANMDTRSFSLSYEINTYLFGEEITKVTKEAFLKDLEQCNQLSLEQWKARPWYDRLAQTIMKLFSPIL